jgi:hypothetical protein
LEGLEDAMKRVYTCYDKYERVHFTTASGRHFGLDYWGAPFMGSRDANTSVSGIFASTNGFYPNANGKRHDLTEDEAVRWVAEGILPKRE